MAKRGKHKKSPQNNSELTVAKLLVLKALIELIKSIIDMINK